MFVNRLVSSILLVAFSPLALGLGGCGGGVGNNAAGQLVKTPELPTDKQAKCKVAKSQSEPLIVEWPDAARGRLESVSRKGLVAVRYEGCELAVLPRCTVKSGGGYGYSPITRKQSKITIKDADELYASMPVGAVKLESKLQLAGQLNVQMTIVGRYESATQNVYRGDLEGECAEATHVIAALTVGSFMFSAGSEAEVGGGVSTVVPAVGGGAKSSSARETIQHDGDEASCTRATITDKAPPEGCGALLQIEVMPLAKGVKAAAPVVVPVPVPVTTPSLPSPPTPDPVIADKPTVPKPPKCKKGERVEAGQCVKPGAKVAAVKPVAKPTIASAAVTCASGQHAVNGRCVDDALPPAEPAPEPAPPPPPVTSCLAGSHLENGACVVDPMRSPQPYPGSYGSGYGDNGNGNGIGVADPQDRPNPWRTLLVYLAVGGGISATTFGIAALSAAGKVSDGCSVATQTCTQDAADARDKAKTLAIVTDVSLGLTIAALVGFFLLPSKVKVGAAPVPRGVAGSASWTF